MSDKKNNDRREYGYLSIRLKTYLSELCDIERSKPEHQRREVPNLTQLARIAGVHKVTMSRLARGKVTCINLDVACKIFDDLYIRGFQPRFNDFFIYIPPEMD
jgi:hypothetical protein